VGKRTAPAFKRTLNALQKYGLLLETDAKLPSVTSLVVGEPVRGPWWAHPQAHAIFQVNCLLADHADVLVARLLSRKVTFIHRPLWGAIFTIGSAREPWQIQDLSKPARALLERVARDAELRTDQMTGGRRTASPGEAARELEGKLLVHSEQIHTEKGSHAKRLQTWQQWADRVGLIPDHLTSASAKQLLEAKLERLNQEFKAKARLPWQVSKQRQLARVRGDRKTKHQRELR
jgi:hypothetical protein